MSSSRVLRMSESVVVGRQAGGSQAGNYLQALAHAAGEAQLTNQCIAKIELRPVWIQSFVAPHCRRGGQGKRQNLHRSMAYHSSIHDNYIADM